MNNRWAQFGGRLGILYVAAGFILIFLGWNGAASHNRDFEQIPYIISGGLGGLGLVVLGSALIIAHSLRTDRVELRGSIDDLRAAIERGGLGGGTAAPARAGAGSGGSGGTVLASTETYHRLTCKVVEGQPDTEAIPVAEATSRGLTPCRVCAPDADTPLRAAGE